MRLDWIIPARYAEVGDDGSMSILGGGVDTLVVSCLGDVAVLRVVLALRVAGSAADWADDHELAVMLERPTGMGRLVYERRLGVPEAVAMDPDREVGCLVAAPCCWSAPGEGAHVLAVRLDGAEVARVPVAVVESGLRVP